MRQISGVHPAFARRFVSTLARIPHITVVLLRGISMPQEIYSPPCDRPNVYRSLRQIARRFPPNKADKAVHPATLTRWILKGIPLSDGSRVKLEAVRFPAGWRSTDEWVDDFLEALTAARTESKLTSGQTGAVRSPAKRQRDYSRAKRELKAAGF
jgi:hypothetical protein